MRSPVTESPKWRYSRASPSPSTNSVPGSPRFGCRVCFGDHATGSCDISIKSQSQSPKRVKRPSSSHYKKPCKFFALGKCTKGSNCTFLHELSSSFRRSPKMTQPHHNLLRVGRVPDPLNLREESLRPHSPGYNNSRPSSRGSLPDFSRKRKVDHHQNFNIMNNGDKRLLGGFLNPIPTTDEEEIDPRLPQLKINLNEGDEKVDKSFPQINVENILNSANSTNVNSMSNVAAKCPHWYSRLSLEFKQHIIHDVIGNRKSKSPALVKALMNETGSTREESESLLQWWFGGSNLYSDNTIPSSSSNLTVSKDSKNTAKPASPALVPPQTPSKAFTRPCKYFSQGFCVKGAACTFLHSSQTPQKEVSFADKPTPETPKGVEHNKMFVRLCRYFVKGLCAKGKDCTFIHPTPEQLEAIKSNNDTASPTLSPTLTPREPSITPKLAGPAQSPRLCLNPGASPVRLSLGNPAVIGQEVKANKMYTKVCKFFQTGKCLKGEQCTFIHEKIDPQILNLEEKISLGENKRVSSPRFARVDNRGYDFPEMNDIQDYIVGLEQAKTTSSTHSNIAAVVLILDKEHEQYTDNLLTTTHNSIKKLHTECDGETFSAFSECYGIGCTSLQPENVAHQVRSNEEFDYYGRAETLCQPRFGEIVRYLKDKKIITKEEICYTYQIEAVNPKYAYKYPYANVSMVFEKGDKGERIEEVAIRGVFEEQHIVLDRTYWDEAFKAKVPPLYLPYYLTEEQLAKYPEPRRTWFCGTHTLFVPVLHDAEFIQLNIDDEWPAGADVPSKYCASRVPIPSVYIRPSTTNSSAFNNISSKQSDTNSNILELIEKQKKILPPSHFRFQETVL